MEPVYIIKPMAGFHTYVGEADDDEDALESRLLIQISTSGRVEDHFRLVFYSHGTIQADFGADKLTTQASLAKFKLSVDTAPESIQMKDNSFFSRWEDVADAVAAQRIHVSENGVDAKDDFLRAWADTRATAAIRWADQAHPAYGFKLQLQSLPDSATSLRRDGRTNTGLTRTIQLASWVAATPMMYCGPLPLLFAPDVERAATAIAEHPDRLAKGVKQILQLVPRVDELDLDEAVDYVKHPQTATNAKTFGQTPEEESTGGKSETTTTNSSKIPKPNKKGKNPKLSETRKRIRAQLSSTESDDSESDDDQQDPGAAGKGRYVIPRNSDCDGNSQHVLWNSAQIANLKKNFRSLAHLDDSILAKIPFKDLNKIKNEKTHRSMTEKMAETFENLKQFPTEVEAGYDDCTSLAHTSRFLRGYVGDSRDLWVQARRAIGINGLDAIGHYETVTIGLNGYVSHKVWHEVHSPSSKTLSIRLLTDSARKSAWSATGEKAGEIREFESIQELKMAVVALDACISKVFPWNASFKTIAIFMHSIDFGEVDLSGKSDRLAFLADFIDEILRFNAHAWDEERHFMSAQEIAGKWAAALLRRPNVTAKPAMTMGQTQKKFKDKKSKEELVPAGVCKNFNKGICTHTGDKHSAAWDSDYILRHICSQWLKDKRRYCLHNHSKKDHK